MAETVGGDASALSAAAKPKAINGHSMSDQQMAELYEKLTGARFKINGLKAMYPFQLGWNACIDFAIKQMRLVCDEPVDEKAKEPAE